jgi:hypothetical protein
MCYYCHVLKNNPRAPIHQSVRCLDCANTYSQVPMIQRTHNHGQLLSLTPSAPPAEGKFFLEILCYMIEANKLFRSFCFQKNWLINQIQRMNH